MVLHLSPNLFSWVLPLFANSNFHFTFKLTHYLYHMWSFLSIIHPFYFSHPWISTSYTYIFFLQSTMPPTISLVLPSQQHMEPLLLFFSWRFMFFHNQECNPLDSNQQCMFNPKWCTPLASSSNFPFLTILGKIKDSFILITFNFW